MVLIDQHNLQGGIAGHGNRIAFHVRHHQVSALDMPSGLVGNWMIPWENGGVTAIGSKGEGVGPLNPGPGDLPSQVSTVAVAGRHQKTQRNQCKHCSHDEVRDAHGPRLGQSCRSIKPSNVLQSSIRGWCWLRVEPSSLRFRLRAASNFAKALLDKSPRQGVDPGVPSSILHPQPVHHSLGDDGSSIFA